MMALEIKNRLFRLNPFVLQQVILAMRLKITHRLVGRSQAVYHRNPDAPK